MKTALLALLLSLSASAAAPTLTTEVLVLTSATALPAASGRVSMEIQNLGPSPIYCALVTSALAVAGKAREIRTGATWVLDVPENTPVYCVSAVAQVTGAATIVTELRAQ